MVTWAVIIAKLIEFIASKLIGKKIDLVLDKKARAARTFLKLYDAFIDLQKILFECTAVLDAATENHKVVIFSRKMLDLIPRIQDIHNKFFYTLDETASTIHLIDPELSKLMRLVAGPKPIFMTALGKVLKSADFHVEFTGLHPFQSIVYTMPVNVERLHIDDYYSEDGSSDLSLGLFPRLSGQEALAKAIRDTLVADQIECRDFEKISSLSNTLKVHQANVAEAREVLRQFIAKTFSIEDLLFR